MRSRPGRLRSLTVVLAGAVAPVAGCGRRPGRDRARRGVVTALIADPREAIDQGKAVPELLALIRGGFALAPYG